MTDTEPRATYGVLCVSSREPACRFECDDSVITYSVGASMIDALPAALPYFGAAIGLVVGEIIVWLIRGAT